MMDLEGFCCVLLGTIPERQMKFTENIIQIRHPAERELIPGSPESEARTLSVRRYTQEEVTRMSVMSRGFNLTQQFDGVKSV
jgi:uncharacterized protein Smg (DUF494 family)